MTQIRTFLLFSLCLSISIGLGDSAFCQNDQAKSGDKLKPSPTSQEEKISVGQNFNKDQLVVWCIVPFDAKNRGPSERAVMVKELGLTRVAYDWRQKHKSEFEQEIIEYKKNGLEYFAFWKWDSSMAPLIKKHDIKPQVWQNFRGQPKGTQQEKIDQVIEQLGPAAKEVKELGLKFGIYNHGGWAGEPANLVEVCKQMRTKHGLDNVGIVYNFHHAHEHIEDFKSNFEMLQPYLMCVNLNGMADAELVAAKTKENKILPIGTGNHEKAMLKTVAESGYTGPIGVLGHRAEMDAKVAVQLNLDGLETIVKVQETKPDASKKKGQ